MTNFRRLMLSIVLGLTTALAGVAYAQNAAQDKKTESCCAMETCCCKGDSCKMKSCPSMNHAATHEHESCCGDSCDMKKDGASKAGATASDKHECCCGGDSCDMKDKKEKS